MDYYDSAFALTITRKRALQELRLHSIFDYNEFNKEMGIHRQYSAQSVLRWLGY